MICCECCECFVCECCEHCSKDVFCDCEPCECCDTIPCEIERQEQAQAELSYWSEIVETRDANPGGEEDAR